MALSPELAQFCQRWREKANGYTGKDTGEWFDKFFTLWVNALYTEVAWQTRKEGLSDDKAAQDNLLHYLGARKFIGALREDAAVVAALTEVQEFLRCHVYYFKLDRRTGARQPEDDERLLIGLRSNATNDQGKSILEALYCVRCNMFHGHKAFDPMQVELLRPMIVLLEKIIDITQKQLERET